MKKLIPVLAIVALLGIAACTHTAPNGAPTTQFVDTTSLRTLDARASIDTAPATPAEPVSAAMDTAEAAHAEEGAHH
jgi:hypothetical protein